MKVISKKLWSPQEFVEAITDKCYAIDGDNDSIAIRQLLEDNGYSNVWDYMLDEVENMPESVHQVVLVDCLIWNSREDHYVHSYRWFEVPDDKIDKFKNINY